MASDENVTAASPDQSAQTHRTDAHFKADTGAVAPEAQASTPTGDDLLSLDTIEQLIVEKVRLFNEQIPNEPKFAKFVSQMEKEVLIQVGETVGFATRLANSTLENIARVNLSDTNAEADPDPEASAPDITIITDHATMSGMLSGTLKPIKAYATKKLRVKAQVKDLLILKKLLAQPKE